jgi:hypothetical protein
MNINSQFISVGDLLIDILENRYGVMSQSEAMKIARRYKHLIVIVVSGEDERAEMFIGDLEMYLTQVVGNNTVHEIYFPCKYYDLICATFGANNEFSTNQSKNQLN